MSAVLEACSIENDKGQVDYELLEQDFWNIVENG